MLHENVQDQMAKWVVASNWQAPICPQGKLVRCIASSCDHHGHLVLTVFAKHWYQNCIWSFLSQDILLLLKNKNISPNVGLEPTTLRLRVSCSTDWASRALVDITFLKVSLLLLTTKQARVAEIKKWRMISKVLESLQYCQDWPTYPLILMILNFRKKV